MKTVNYDLKTPISYANGSGATIECNFIELREPKGEVSHLCMAIEGLLQSSLMQMAGMLDDETIKEAKESAKESEETAFDDEDEEKDEEKDGKSILMLMSSSGVDMEKVVVKFRHLFKQVAWMGGEKKITEARMNDMSHTDFRNMLGVYYANFIQN